MKKELVNKFKELSANSLKLRLEVLIPEQEKTIKDSIAFKQKLIQSYIEDMEKLEHDIFFAKYIAYKKEAITSLQILVYELKNELIALEEEKNYLGDEIIERNLIDFIIKDMKMFEKFTKKQILKKLENHVSIAEEVRQAICNNYNNYDEESNNQSDVDMLIYYSNIANYIAERY